MSKPTTPPPSPRDDTLGRCALCGKQIIRYGPAGKPLCAGCEARRGRAVNPPAAPATQPPAAGNGTG